MSNASDGKADKDLIISLLRYVELLVRRSPVKVDVDKARNIFETIINESHGKGVSDEELAEMYGYSQSEIRKTLHILYDNGLVKFRRGRHPQHGATRYYWYVDFNAVNRVLLMRKKAVLQKLKRKLEYEKSNQFFYCRDPKRDTIVRYTFDEAFTFNFQCPQTEEPMEIFDNRAYIEILEHYIRLLEEEISRDEAALQAD